MQISIIVAVAANRVIGNNNQTPWRLPRDLQRFKQLTMGKPIIMGRKTHESIGRILPRRCNIVVSRTWEAGCYTQTFDDVYIAETESGLGAVGAMDAEDDSDIEIITHRDVLQCEVHNSLPAALCAAQDCDCAEIMVIGGAEVYAQVFPQVSRMYLTIVRHYAIGDAYFPAWDLADWEIVAQQDFAADDKHAYAHRFLTLQRVRAAQDRWVTSTSYREEQL